MSMFTRSSILFLMSGLAFAGCKKKAPDTSGPGSDVSGSATTGSGSGTMPATGSAGSAGSGSDAMTGSAGPDAGASDDRIVVKDGLATPESVLYDADADLYIVSNINGAPTDTDDNGYISKLGPDGKMVEAKWIDGSKPDVKLDAPKGSGIWNGTLYVADITVVRQFDVKTGKQKADIKIDGAKFLNDIAVGKDGVFVSDTGVDASFKPTGDDAIYKIDKDGKVKPFIKNKELGGPNGLFVKDDAVWVVTFGSGEVYEVDAKGTKGKTAKPPKGQLDGLVAVDGGDVYLSSWEASAVYKMSKDAQLSESITDVKAPADFGYDTKRKKLLIPLFQDNAIVIVSPK